MESSRTQVFKLADSFLVQTYFKYVLLPKWKFGLKLHGIGRHNKEEIEDFMFTELRAVSAILGKKPFILGDTPCEDDCGIFGILAQVYWGSPGSPYEKLLKGKCIISVSGLTKVAFHNFPSNFKHFLFGTGDLTNLVDYCERMKASFWPDWDKQLARVETK